MAEDQPLVRPRTQDRYDHRSALDKRVDQAVEDAETPEEAKRWLALRYEDARTMEQWRTKRSNRYLKALCVPILAGLGVYLILSGANLEWGFRLIGAAIVLIAPEFANQVFGFFGRGNREQP